MRWNDVVFSDFSLLMWRPGRRGSEVRYFSKVLQASRLGTSEAGR